METEAQANIEDLNLIQKEAEDKIATSIKLQDDVRAKIKHWNGSQEIRKWRQKNKT